MHNTSKQDSAVLLRPAMALVPCKESSTSAARWLACARRDSSMSSAFVYAVKTTRIYCRPNCGSRLARRSNVEFFDTPQGAEDAGHRACKRCKPSHALASVSESLDIKIGQAVEIIRESALKGEKVKLGDLAEQVGLSRWHLQKVFKKKIGCSPHQMSLDTQSEYAESPRTVDTSSLPEIMPQTTFAAADNDFAMNWSSFAMDLDDCIWLDSTGDDPNDLTTMFPTHLQLGHNLLSANDSDGHDRIQYIDPTLTYAPTQCDISQDITRAIPRFQSG